MTALTATTCPVCAQMLDPCGECVGCLLRVGLGEDAPEMFPEVFGEFEIMRREDGTLWELGRGGMGVSFRAMDTVLHRVVALKVIEISRDPAQAPAQRERFLREARVAAGLHHPNVAEVFQFGTLPATAHAYYAMKWIDGETLEARVRRHGPLTIPAALEMAVQIARALVAAAERNLVHRDLKPGNVMLSRGPRADTPHATIIDFGLAKAVAAGADGGAHLTHHGVFVGTPAFASPEQFAPGAADVDTRTDIYSLGVTLWYALTGRVPFAGRTLEEWRDDPARVRPPFGQLATRGVPACVVNLMRRVLAADPAGRPASAGELLDALEACRQRLARPRAPRRWMAAAAGAAVLAMAGGSWWWRHPVAVTTPPRAATTAPMPIPEKSVAVLPLDSFSTDKDNAFFADGVQDEILTDLANVADLKVISRSSVMQYRQTGARNLREIGRNLGVAYVVEGSVQRAGGRIKVTAQLIDTRTDTHRWAAEYVRDFSDVFAIQGEIARAIAGQLQAAISPQAQAAMEDVPTHDEQAYQLYLRARAVWNDSGIATADEMRDQVLDLLRQATARDPNFARAFAFLAEVQLGLFGEHTAPADAEAVHGYAETVARLRPGSTDANVAMGCYDYFVRHDYERAREEFADAVRLTPNDDRAYFFLGRVEARLGRWADALAHDRRASELDPENNPRFWEYILTLSNLGHAPEALALVDRRLAAHPDHSFLHGLKAQVLLSALADTRATRKELVFVPAKVDTDGWITDLRLTCDIYDRDFAAAARDLAACPLDVVGGTPRAVDEAMIAHHRGDARTATALFTDLRATAEKRLREKPDDTGALNNLTLYDAYLGHREAALDEGRRLRSLVKPGDAADAISVNCTWAHVLVLVGERDEAIRVLQTVCGQPAGVSYGDLHEPDWDPLRGDPRFAALLASLAPK